MVDAQILATNSDLVAEGKGEPLMMEACKFKSHGIAISEEASRHERCYSRLKAK
jgi:hypothetical protein